MELFEEFTKQSLKQKLEEQKNIIKLKGDEFKLMCDKYKEHLNAKFK